jgi:hypothetical protein
MPCPGFERARKWNISKMYVHFDRRGRKKHGFLGIHFLNRKKFSIRRVDLRRRSRVRGGDLYTHLLRAARDRSLHKQLETCTHTKSFETQIFRQNMIMNSKNLTNQVQILLKIKVQPLPSFHLPSLPPPPL